MPPFFKPLGLDLIIRPGGEVVLIELQHHFGRFGLMHLYPAVSAGYRKTVTRLRRRYGVSPSVNRALMKICADKTATYRTLSRFQPPTLSYYKWSSRVESWLGELKSDFVLAKPPRGRCGRGIHVFRRRRIGPHSISPPPGGTLLLQEYMESKKIFDDRGLPHVGCIRHIVLIVSDGSLIGLIHMPSYWRVAPSPFLDQPPNNAFTANISRGASPAPVDESDQRSVEAAVEEIVSDLVGKITGAGLVAVAARASISPDGTVPALCAGDGAEFLSPGY